METLKLAMLGFGNAGRAFAKLLIDKRENIKNCYNYDIQVTAICTLTRGNLVDGKGIDLVRALEEIETDGRFNKTWGCSSLWSSQEILQNTDYDVLIEITPLNIMSGQPAISNIIAAFERKKHVITANKGPIAWAYRELKEKAKEQGVVFLHETTVMDGTPIFNLVEETLPMCKIKSIKGILNTTTNFVLEQMSEGKNFKEAINEGKRRGFVESDPSMDIEGYDAAAKTAALINVLMDGNLTPLDIKRKGIEHITMEDIKTAEEREKVIKVLCEGRIENGQAFGEVKPVEIDKDDFFASVKGTSSILTLVTDLMGEITIVENNPEIEQTGFGLFSDLLRLIKTLEER